MNFESFLKNLKDESKRKLFEIKKSHILNELSSNQEFNKFNYMDQGLLNEITFNKEIEIVSKKINTGMKIKSIVPLLTKAIYTIDLNKSEYKTRIRNSPWIRLPNVKEFKISIKGYNLIAKAFGINLKIKPTLQFVKHRNDDLNRYIEHQVIRLEKSKSNPSLYWKIASILMKRSNA
jgi:hypothetical protein